MIEKIELSSLENEEYTIDDIKIFFDDSEGCFIMTEDMAVLVHSLDQFISKNDSFIVLDENAIEEIHEASFITLTEEQFKEIKKLLLNKGIK